MLQLRRRVLLHRSLAGLIGLSGSVAGREVLAASALATTGCDTPSAAVQLSLSAAMLMGTCLVQLVVTTLVAELGHHNALIQWCAPHRHRRSLVILLGACVIGLALLTDILLWAVLFRLLELFPDLNSSFYFSGITFTSVGYGDVTLPSCWRLMSVGLGLNGLLMAGWSTALLLYLVQRMMELRLSQHGRG